VMSLLDARTGPSYGTIGPMEQGDDREEDRLLYNSYGDGDNNNLATETEDDFSVSESEVQDGVRKIQAISRTWTQRSLIVAYLRFEDDWAIHTDSQLTS